MLNVLVAMVLVGFHGGTSPVPAQIRPYAIVQGERPDGSIVECDAGVRVPRVLRGGDITSVWAGTLRLGPIRTRYVCFRVA